MKKSRKDNVWHGKIKYENYEEEFEDPEDVDQMIRKAQNQIAGTGMGISDKLISLEVTSTNVPDLTLIDLPGITRVAVKDQPENIGEQVKKLIKEFIKKQETIILVVVPCNVDIATTEALKMAQEVDPNGKRTLAFNEDVINLTTGDEVKSMPQLNIFTALRKQFDLWKKDIDNVGQNFEKKLEIDLQQYDEKYRGREFPGFINYKTFEMFVKQQIKLLEEPAIRRLTEISDLIRDEFIKLAQLNFQGFPNFFRMVKTKLEKIKQIKESEAESMLKTQFKMELMVYTQDSTYKDTLCILKTMDEEKERKRLGVALPASHSLYDYSDREAALEELKRHLKTYYSIVSQRLADQVPLVIRYMVVQDSAAQLQREMVLLIKDKVNIDDLLKEDHDISIKRNNLKGCQKRLTDALKYLTTFLN